MVMHSMVVALLLQSAMQMRQHCGGCWATRRLLAAPAPPPDPAQPMQPQARLETLFSGTTTVLFIATVSYVVCSAIYACVRAVRYEAGQLGPPGPGAGAAAPPREETKRALEAIPVRVVVAPQQPDEDCAVCLAAYAAGDEVRVLPACRHGFHRECIDRWLLTRMPTCPVCRALVAARADAKEEACATGHGGGVGSAAGSLALPAAI